MKPTIGRIVHYRLTGSDVQQIDDKRSQYGSPFEGADEVSEGDVCAAIVTAVRPSPAVVNLQVFLDGNDQVWATARGQGALPGQWDWPERMTEAVEQEIDDTGGEP